MAPKHPLPGDFLRFALSGMSIYKLQLHYGVSRTVILRWLALPEVVEAMAGVEPLPSEPPTEPLRPPADGPPRPAEPPGPAAPRERAPGTETDPTAASLAIRKAAAAYAHKVVEALVDAIDADDAPWPARIAAADKLAGLLPAPPEPKIPNTPIPRTPVEFYEWLFHEVRGQMSRNSSNPAAFIAAARRLETTFASLNDARAAEEKKAGGFAQAMSTIVELARRQPIGVLDEVIARLSAVREERAPAAQA